jgi:hypothetical protein
MEDYERHQRSHETDDEPFVLFDHL